MPEIDGGTRRMGSPCAWTCHEPHRMGWHDGRTTQASNPGDRIELNCQSLRFHVQDWWHLNSRTPSAPAGEVLRRTSHYNKFSTHRLFICNRSLAFTTPTQPLQSSSVVCSLPNPRCKQTVFGLAPHRHPPFPKAAALGMLDT